MSAFEEDVRETALRARFAFGRTCIFDVCIHLPARENGEGEGGEGRPPRRGVYRRGIGETRYALLFFTISK